jgi:mRNA interferase YafQ
LKKPASAKRSKPIRDSHQTKQFQKDWDRLSASGRFDMGRLKTAMVLLVGGDPMPPEYLDHPLKGEWLEFRECHIGGDFLLIYKIAPLGKLEQVIFVRAGTHAELFKSS